MNERESPPPLDDLDKRLKAARADAFEGDGDEQGTYRAEGMSAGLSVATELVAAVMVAVAIGWFLDDWLETQPLFLLVFFFLGAAAGALNVYRRAQYLVGAGKAGSNTSTTPPDEQAK